MSELPSGTLTVLHTDIESSTRLTAHLGERYPEVLAAHCRLLRGAFAANEGRRGSAPHQRHPKSRGVGTKSKASLSWLHNLHMSRTGRSVTRLG
jgi:hypothetical protein